MTFKLPSCNIVDFNQTPFRDEPTVVYQRVMQPGVATESYHATSIYPEYFHSRKNEWHLLKESRMDCVVVLKEVGSLDVMEFRHIKVGDLVACGRQENGEDGIFVHTE